LEDKTNIKRVFKYLKGNSNYGIKFTKDDTLNNYADAEYYDGNKKTRKSTSIFVIKIGNGSTSW